MRGVIQIGERWNTVTCAADGAIAGTYWIALAPVPIDATRSPSTDLLWSHRDEWNARPRNREAPGIVGTYGTLSIPSPLTSTSAVNDSPTSDSRHHCCVASSHRADEIATPVRT